MHIDTSQPCQPVTPEERECRNGHSGYVVWFTGLSGAGKSTLARYVERQLHDAGYRTFLLDGDELRQGLCSDLGFSEADRHENLRRVGAVCQLLAQADIIVFAAFVSPFRSDRHMVRSLIGKDRFAEVYCNAPLQVCEQRDVKGLYRKARRGEITDFTGISSPYEPPDTSEIVVSTGTEKADVCAAQVLAFLMTRISKGR